MTVQPSTVTSHRQIVRATSIIGGASAVNIVVGLARNKAAALLLGPAGLGVIGLLLSLVTTIASVFGMGVAGSAVRQIAECPERLAPIRKSLQWLTVLLAGAGTLFTYLFRTPLADHVLGDIRLADQVGWLAPAVALTIWSSIQISLLNGLRRLRDLAMTQVGGAFFGTVIGVAALAAWGAGGIVAYVIAAPLSIALVGVIFTIRLPKPTGSTSHWWREIAPVLRLGIPMMLSGISLTAGALIIRSIIGTRIGPVALGEFTAAWTLSITYVGFILQAMGTDYLPRLTAVIRDKVAACETVNDQAEIALLLALPVMIFTQSVLPWIIKLLYSDAFSGTALVLRWLILADVIKIASWPLGYIIVAEARAKTFLAVETCHLILTLALVSIFIDKVGLQAVGISYLVSYVFYIILVGYMAYKRIGFIPRPRYVLLFLAGFTAIALIAIVDRVEGNGAALLGAVFTIAATAYAATTLAKLWMGKHPVADGTA